MKKCMVVLFLCLSAYGQSVSSGRGVFTGAGSLTYGAGGGAPQTYPARTDACIIGYAAGDHTNCVNGATPGQAGSAMSFLGQTGDPMPWYQTAGTIDPVNTAVTDPDFGSYQVVLTSGAWGASTGMSAGPTATYNEQAGEFDPFSQDNSLLLIANNGGNWGLIALDVSLIHSKGCSPSTPCSVFTGISTRVTDTVCTNPSVSGTGCIALNGNGSFSFSRSPSEPHVIYELVGTGTGAQVQINKLLVTCPSGAPGTWSTNPCTFSRTPYINFTSNTPANCSVLSSGYTSNAPWTGAFSVANDGSIGYAAGGAGDWAATTAYNNTAVRDAFIYPTVNNSSITISNAAVSGSGPYTVTLTISRNLAASGYHIVVTGLKPVAYNGTFTSTAIGSNTVSYSLASNPGACTDCTGSLPGSNAFQATSAGTTSSSEVDWMTYCQAPGDMCPTDGTIPWTNIGKIGGQGPGFDLLFYNPASGCRRYNTMTGYILNGTGYSGTPSSGYMQSDSVANNFNGCLDQYDDCSSGTCKPPTGNYAGYTSSQITGCQTAAQSTQPFTDRAGIHDGGIKANSRYLAWSPTGGTVVDKTSSCRNSSATYAEQSCYNHIWDATTNLTRAEHSWVNWNGTDINGQSDGHEIDGYSGNWKGGFAQYHSYAEPNFPNVVDYGTSPNCQKVAGGAVATSVCSIGSPYSGAPALLVDQGTSVVGAPFDHHGANRSGNSTDTSPVLYFNTAVPAMGRTSGSGYPGASVGYNEIIGMANQFVSGCVSSTATFCEWRFAHNWGTGSVPQFNGQNEQGMNSQDGSLAAFATDVMGTRGSVSPDWTTGAKAYGAMINPVCASGCTNAMHSSFQQMNSAGCTAGGTEPSSWPQTPGVAISDGSCTWENVSGMYGSEQLPCNGLRADILSTAGATIYQNTNVFALSSSTIYQAVSCTPVAPATSCSFPITEGAVPSWGGCSTFGSQCTDAAGIVFQNIGQNDCRTDVILVDLMSAKSR